MSKKSVNKSTVKKVDKTVKIVKLTRVKKFKRNPVAKTKFAKLLNKKEIMLTKIQSETGVSYPVLVDLKAGKRKNFRQRSLKDIADYLGVQVSDII